MNTRNFVSIGGVAIAATLMIVIVFRRQPQGQEQPVGPGQSEIKILEPSGNNVPSPLVGADNSLSTEPTGTTRASLSELTAPVPPPPVADSQDEASPSSPAIVSLGQLHPTLGGAEAFGIKYRSVSSEERSARITEIELGLASYNEAEHTDKGDEHLYQALKDEYYWLRDSLSPKHD